MEEKKYPVGKFAEPSSYTPNDIREWINEFETLPSRLRAAVEDLPDEVLDTPYREGGWTVRQVVHHLPDSHMNCYIRFRLALTEENPNVKTYKESLWAQLPDASKGPVRLSLELLDALHRRLVVLMKAMKPAEWEKTYMNPETGKTWKLANVLALYAWHGRHHLAHVGLVTDARKTPAV